MTDKLAEIGQRLKRLKGNTFENFVSTSALINREEKNDSSSRSASVGAYSEHSNSDREEEMADNNDDNRALEDFS
ncbi:hypothetical protein ACFX1S_046878 [Malus domestica]